MRNFLALFLCCLPSLLAEDFGVRLILGMTDSAPAPWDGSISVRGGGSVSALEGWRFTADDRIVSNESWK